MKKDYPKEIPKAIEDCHHFIFVRDFTRADKMIELIKALGIEETTKPQEKCEHEYLLKNRREVMCRNCRETANFIGAMEPIDWDKLWEDFYNTHTAKKEHCEIFDWLRNKLQTK